MPSIEELQKQINEINERNQRVEADKAWETSLTRKILVAIFTYLAIVLFFFIADLPRPFINAIVPTLGFILSTLTVPMFKNMWLRYVYRKHGQRTI